MSLFSTFMKYRVLYIENNQIITHEQRLKTNTSGIFILIRRFTIYKNLMINLSELIIAGEDMRKVWLKTIEFSMRKSLLKNRKKKGRKGSLAFFLKISFRL